MKKPCGAVGVYLSLFGLSLAFAFGIGYRVGQNSAPPAASAPVQASSQLPAPRPAAAAPMAWSGKGKATYTLYLASFQNFHEAEKEKTRLEGKGLSGVEIMEKRFAGQDSRSWYRLGYGRFATIDAAVEYGRHLTDKGIVRDFWPKEIL